MTDNTPDDNDEQPATVGLTPQFKQQFMQILQYAASRDRTIIEFRTAELDSGGRHLTHAFPITEHVETLEGDIGFDAHYTEYMTTHENQ